MEGRYLKHLYPLQHTSFLRRMLLKASFPPPEVVNKLKANPLLSIYGGF
jgi:hypothetical protein